jgi:hypothetical protein
MKGNRYSCMTQLLTQLVERENLNTSQMTNCADCSSTSSG